MQMVPPSLPLRWPSYAARPQIEGDRLVVLAHDASDESDKLAHTAGRVRLLVDSSPYLRRCFRTMHCSAGPAMMAKVEGMAAEIWAARLVVGVCRWRRR